jgi:hypothetical protein
MSCGGCPKSWLGWTHCWDDPAFLATFVPFFDPQMGRPDNDACAIGLHPFGRLPTVVLQRDSGRVVRCCTRSRPGTNPIPAKIRRNSRTCTPRPPIRPVRMCLTSADGFRWTAETASHAEGHFGGSAMTVLTTTVMTVAHAETAPTTAQCLINGRVMTAAWSWQCGGYAIIGSMADRGARTCTAPYEAGSSTPWSKKKITPSLTTAKFW